MAQSQPPTPPAPSAQTTGTKTWIEELIDQQDRFMRRLVQRQAEIERGVTPVIRKMIDVNDDPD